MTVGWLTFVMIIVNTMALAQKFNKLLGPFQLCPCSTSETRLIIRSTPLCMYYIIIMSSMLTFFLSCGGGSHNWSSSTSSHSRCTDICCNFITRQKRCFLADTISFRSNQKYSMFGGISKLESADIFISAFMATSESTKSTMLVYSDL